MVLMLLSISILKAALLSAGDGIILGMNFLPKRNIQSLIQFLDYIQLEKNFSKGGNKNELSRKAEKKTKTKSKKGPEEKSEE